MVGCVDLARDILAPSHDPDYELCLVREPALYVLNVFHEVANEKVDTRLHLVDCRCVCSVDRVRETGCLSTFLDFQQVEAVCSEFGHR